MLTAVYKNHRSIVKRLASRLGETEDQNPVFSSHAFYRDGKQVAGMYNYMSGPSRIELKDEHYLFRRKNAVVFFTQYYTLERDGRAVATAKESKRLLGSKSTVNFPTEASLGQLTIRSNFKKLLGGEYLVLDGKSWIGNINYDSDLGADIALPTDMPLALQIFLFRVGYNMWQRGGPR